MSADRNKMLSPKVRNWDLGQSTENNILFNNEPLILNLVLLMIDILFQFFWSRIDHDWLLPTDILFEKVQFLYI